MARDVNEVIERLISVLGRETDRLHGLDALDREDFTRLKDSLNTALAVSKEKRERLLSKTLAKLTDQEIDALIARAPRDLVGKQS